MILYMRKREIQFLFKIKFLLIKIMADAPTNDIECYETLMQICREGME